MSILHRTMIGLWAASAGEVFPITLGDMLIDTTAKAMCQLIGTDLSGFAGVAGSRKKLIFKTATEADAVIAWAGEIGGGEALDAKWADDMADDGTADWTFFDATLTFDTDHYVLTRTAYSQGFYHTNATTLSKITKITCDVKAGTSAGGMYPNIGNRSIGSVMTPTGDWQTFSAYAHQRSSGEGRVGFTTYIDVNGQTQFFKNFLSYDLTDVAATGLHLYTTKTGSTRGVVSVNAAADLTTITSLEVRNG